MSNENSYIPPKVWQWDTSNGGNWASINRPIAGATHEKTLNKGKHPFQLYSLATPNGVKVTVMLEELLELGFISLRSLILSYQAIVKRQSVCLGCFGKWAARHTLVVVLVIFMLMLRIK